LLASPALLALAIEVIEPVAAVAFGG